MTAPAPGRARAILAADRAVGRPTLPLLYGLATVVFAALTLGPALLAAAP